MFTLYMKWDAWRILAPDDIQFILTPHDALAMACIYYELDYLEYDERAPIIPQTVLRRRENTYNRYALQAQALL